MSRNCSQLVQACLRPYKDRGMWLLQQSSGCSQAHLIHSRTKQEWPCQPLLLCPVRFLVEDWAEIAPPASTTGAKAFSPPEGCGFTTGKPHRRNLTLPPISCSLWSSPFPPQHRDCKMKLQPELAPPEKSFLFHRQVSRGEQCKGEHPAGTPSQQSSPCTPGCAHTWG